MKYIKLYYSALVFLLMLAGCKRETINTPLSKNKDVPGAVFDVAVTNLSGGAILTYKLPDSKNLLYVKAVYETPQGHFHEVKTSYYDNKMTLGCFSDTLAHEVTLYAVTNSEIASAPVTVTVNPLTAPYELTFRSLKVLPTFGGVNIQASNIEKADLAIVPLVDTLDNGNWATMDNVYTADSIINVNIRGLDTARRKYGFYIRDRCGNTSDTMVLYISPFFEKLLDKKLWSSFPLPGDAVTVYGTTVPTMWNGDYHHGWPVTFTDESAAGPQTLTIDLGLQYTLSRLQVNSFEDFGQYFGRGAMRYFEIWGSNNPSLDGTYDESWTKLEDCSVIKPSGSPLGVETGEDKAAGYAGFQADFQAGLPKYRFIRIRNLRNWQGGYFMSIVQFTLWGNE